MKVNLGPARRLRRGARDRHAGAVRGAREGRSAREPRQPEPEGRQPPRQRQQLPRRRHHGRDDDPPPGCTTDCATANADGTYPFVFNNDIVDSSFGVTSPIVLYQLTPDGSLVSTDRGPDR